MGDSFDAQEGKGQRRKELNGSSGPLLFFFFFLRLLYRLVVGEENH